MKATYPIKSTMIDDSIVFWPGFVDMVISVLMIFLLTYFLQTALSLQNLETQIVFNKQAELETRFKEAFDKEIKNGIISVQQGVNHLRIRFSDRILFPTGDYKLQASGETVLRICAGIFRSSSSNYKLIQVEGHTDPDVITSTKYPANNWELSAGRAISVVQFLKDKSGLDAKFFSANGRAEFVPLASNDNERGKAMNRRIELHVIFSTPETN
jgi:chemotaxis protein MotB